MSVHAALQKAIFNALRADAAVSAVVADRIFDDVPLGKDYPMISFGPADGVPVDDAARCVEGMAVSIQLDCWSQDQGRLRPVKQLTEAAAAALHRADLQLESGYRLLEVTVSHRAFLDRDGRTGHGIITVEAEIDGL